MDLDTFLKKFHSKDHPGHYNTFQHFLNNTQVRIGNKMRQLKEYCADKKITAADIKLLYDNICNRDEYLTRFYNLSLRIQPDKTHFNVPGVMPMKNNELNNNQCTFYKNIIRNLHFKDILQNTKSGLENIPTYMDMLLDIYLHNIIDYKILTPSAIFYMKNGRLGSVFSSYYFRASILNPYLVYSLNMSVLHGTKIFTPTLGWSSYCYGFLECPNVIEYVGTDVIPDVCEKTKTFANNHPSNAMVKIYCKPSEDLLGLKTFVKNYTSYFDVVFFSPPYYRLELYEGANQSTNKYKTYEEWLDKYWENTIKLCHTVLETNGKLCYILSGYGSDNTKEQYDLVNDMNNITKKYFKLKSTQPMFNKNVHVTAHKETGEKIMVFTKK